MRRLKHARIQKIISWVHSRTGGGGGGGGGRQILPLQKRFSPKLEGVGAQHPLDDYSSLCTA